MEGPKRAAVAVPFKLPMVHTKINQNDKIPYPLTIDEALQFLENVLGIDNPIQCREKNRKKFLDEFVRRMNTELPFANIPIIPSIDRLLGTKPPSLQECKEDILRRWGGPCPHLNTFSKALLDLLGFKTHHIGGNAPGDTTYDSHCGIVACDVGLPGSRHIVETGTVRPVHRAIPIDFEDESPIYKFGGMKLKFFRGEHGAVWSCSRTRKSAKNNPHIFEDGGTSWKLDLVYWTSVQRSRAYLVERSRYTYRYPSIQPWLHEGCGFVTRRDSSRCQAAGTGELFIRKYFCEGGDEVTLMTEDEFLDFIAEELPQYPRSKLTEVINSVKYIRRLHKYSLSAQL